MNSEIFEMQDLRGATNASIIQGNDLVSDDDVIS